MNGDWVSINNQFLSVVSNISLVAAVCAVVLEHVHLRHSKHFTDPAAEAVGCAIQPWTDSGCFGEKENIQNQTKFLTEASTSVTDYHVGEVNERIVHRHDLNPLLQCHTHHQATNAAKSATDQVTNIG